MSGPQNPWDARYGTETYFYGTAPNDFLLSQAPLLPAGAQVLSLAEGEGRNAVFLAKRHAAVTGVDGSVRGLEKAQELAAREQVSIATVHADLKEYDFGLGAWDAVVSIWCHLPPPLKDRVHAGIRAGLKSGGLLVLEHYHPKQLSYGTGGPPDPALMDTLAELLPRYPGWAVVHAAELEREVHEGAGHDGASFVTQLVVRKP